jgi:hypothetical protein
VTIALFLVFPEINSYGCVLRLDNRGKELQQQKDDLIKETKVKVAATESVRQQLDVFLRVCANLSTISVR